ncbi:MAG: RNA-binding protein [Actinobacteria bacterium]|nr:MAG: RNA-binding protein [Actinomycetota bacterium]
MSTKIYVGNLSYNTTEDQVKELIEKTGSVESVNLIIDKYSGRSKGFAFVEMTNDEDVAKAISETNGVELDGRKVTVNEARPPKQNNRGFNSGYGDRSGGGFKKDGSQNRGFRNRY